LSSLDFTKPYLCWTLFEEHLLESPSYCDSFVYIHEYVLLSKPLTYQCLLEVSHALAHQNSAFWPRSVFCFSHGSYDNRRLIFVLRFNVFPFRYEPDLSRVFWYNSSFKRLKCVVALINYSNPSRSDNLLRHQQNSHVFNNCTDIRNRKPHF
jgi:hypothetical protein